VNSFEWVDKFHEYWQNKNINAIFDENCEYWETPFKRINGLENIRKQWFAIIKMENMRVSCLTIVGQNEHVFANFELEFDNRSQ